MKGQEKGGQEMTFVPFWLRPFDIDEKYEALNLRHYQVVATFLHKNYPASAPPASSLIPARTLFSQKSASLLLELEVWSLSRGFWSGVLLYLWPESCLDLLPPAEDLASSEEEEWHVLLLLSLGMAPRDFLGS